ncbi:MAG TPA: bifunctional UDP-sugar hydrolase/5'-nucleotidase, partial [Kofleriaceae bacterium]|nr:bifunctional UDP-sugar hydrolase/5'-nucleotidase [Kofleriaceae bacterium]
MRRAAIAGMAAIVCLAGCTVERDQPNLVGQDIRLTIIHTSDIHSRLFPYNFVPNTFDQDYGLLPANAPFGGIARIATLVKRIRRDSNRSLWLDSGDAFQGAPVFNMFKGEAEMRALSLAGMEGEVLGNHEFDLGSKNLFEKIDAWSQFPHLAANYAWDDVPGNGTVKSLRDVIQPYQIYDVQGLRVGVIGMGNEDTLTSIFEGGNSLGFRPIDNTQALESYVRLIRPQVDLVVVVSHLGLDADEGLTASEAEDQNFTVPGVDLILGGHLHIVTNPPKVLPNDDGSTYCKTADCETLLVHSGAFAKYVGRLDLVVRVGTDNADPEKRSRIVSFAYKNIPVDSKVPEDADVANLRWPYSVKLSQEIDLNGVFAWVAPTGGAKILRNDASGGDSQLGNLVARAMQVQEGVDAEFAMTNSLGIRADFERGA